jgi:hypothetical protein
MGAKPPGAGAEPSLSSVGMGLVWPKIHTAVPIAPPALPG